MRGDDDVRHTPLANPSIITGRSFHSVPVFWQAAAGRRPAPADIPQCPAAHAAVLPPPHAAKVCPFRLPYRDECERVEVERRFSLAKRKCGMGRITAKLRETAAHVIAKSVLVLKLRKIQCALLRMLSCFWHIFTPRENEAFVQ